MWMLNNDGRATRIANLKNIFMLRRAGDKHRLWAHRPLRDRMQNRQSRGVQGASASTGRRRAAVVEQGLLFLHPAAVAAARRG